jgi:Sulfotransferase family
MQLEDRFPPPERFADSSDQLHELVSAKLGASDFGGDDYLTGLKVLLLSMDYDPHFSERGRRIAWGELIGALSARVQAIRSMKETPGFDRWPMIDPVVITGIPRTGTTALHKLMAVDPQFQGLQSWLIAAPMPRPPRETWETHPLFRNAVERLNARFAATPSVRAAHSMVAEEVDECLGTLRQSFVSNNWASAWSAANYDLWWQTQSELPAYRLLRRTLKLIGSNDPHKRWLLKNPGHIANLDLLFSVFPDARVIQTHRDPGKAIPSLCELLVQSRSIMEVPRAGLHSRVVGVRETEKWAKAVRDSEPVRQAHRHQILDVIQRDFHRRPLDTIETIYAFLGAELSPPVRAAMTERIEAAPELSHGTHRYDVTDFGLTCEQIRARFGGYVERFDLADEA